MTSMWSCQFLWNMAMRRVLMGLAWELQQPLQCCTAFWKLLSITRRPAGKSKSSQEITPARLCFTVTVICRGYNCFTGNMHWQRHTRPTLRATVLT